MENEQYPYPMNESDMTMLIANQLAACFISPNEVDSNFEPANIVDGLFAISRSIDKLTRVISSKQSKDM